MSNTNNAPAALPGGEELDDLEEDNLPIKTVDKNKLSATHLALFGFNDVEDPRRSYGKPAESGHQVKGGVTGGGGAAAKAANIRARKSRNQTVVYGAVDDDDDNDLTTTQQQQYPVDSDSDSDSDKAGKDGEEIEGEDEHDLETLDIPSIDFEDFWEDDEDEEDDFIDEDAILEAERSALFAAELERERIRNLRLADILKKKEALLERYLKTAKIMISLRKKNIYLQDYLYHLAARKGVLRGETTAHVHPVVVSADGEIFTDANATESQIYLANQQKKLQKKNTIMAVKFARYLRKTGHLFEDEGNGEFVHHHHHRHHAKFLKQDHNDPLRTRLSRGFNIRRSQFQHMKGTVQSKTRQEQMHQHNHPHKHYGHGVHKAVSLIQNRPGPCAGGECVAGKGNLTKKKSLGIRKTFDKKRGDIVMSHAYADKRERKKRLSIKEILERKAQIQIRDALKRTDDALNVMEHHRCKLKRQKNIIKIAQLLHRQYSGVSLLDKERTHLIHFVEHSVTAQNLAKRKALRRQQKNQSMESKKTGVVNMDHQWTKSLERIRELRLKKAKLEKEHRLQLIKKVHNWSQWERRDETATDSVYEYVSKMGAKVQMSKRETDSFKVGLEQFQKQLFTLKETMNNQLVRLFKAKSMLYMAQRRVKDDARVASPAVQGFSIADYERMAIENEESHQKLLERQMHLVEQHQKLQKYMGTVAQGHITKQRTWGALRAGRHDLKQLWELCMVERDNLMKKFKDIRKVKRMHKRLFVQIAVLENKKLFKDFQRIAHRVNELQDKKRILTTRLHHNNCDMRVLSVRMTDTKRRFREDKQTNAATTLKEDMHFYKSTIQQRLHPKLPHTVHDVNMMDRHSMYKFLEPQIDQAIRRTLDLSDEPPKGEIKPEYAVAGSASTKKKKKISFGEIQTKRKSSD